MSSTITSATSTTSSSSTPPQVTPLTTQIFQQTIQTSELTPSMPPCTNYSQEQLLEILSNPHSDLPPDELHDLKDQLLSSLINRKTIDQGIIDRVSHHADLLFLLEGYNKFGSSHRSLYFFPLLVFQMGKTISQDSEYFEHSAISLKKYLPMLWAGKGFLQIEKLDVAPKNQFAFLRANYIASLYGKTEESPKEIEQKIRNLLVEKSPPELLDKNLFKLNAMINPNSHPLAENPLPEDIQSINFRQLVKIIRPSLNLRLHKIREEKQRFTETKCALLELMQEVKALFEQNPLYKPYKKYLLNAEILDVLGIAQPRYPHYADVVFKHIDSIVWRLASLADAPEEVLKFVYELEDEKCKSTITLALISLISYFLEKKDVEHCCEAYKKLLQHIDEEINTNDIKIVAVLHGLRAASISILLKIFNLAIEQNEPFHARELYELIPDEFPLFKQKQLDRLLSLEPSFQKQQAE